MHFVQPYWLGFSCLLFLATLVTAPSLADPSNSPLGVWRTIDDHTGTPRSLIAITQVGDRLQGKVIKIFPRPGDTGVCGKCDGPKKGQPVLGMTILWDLRQDGSDWSDGTILDPDSGNTYSATIRLEGGGKELYVRGYLGLSIIGRSQTWQREN